MTAANRYFDLIESGIDLAIRTREHEADSGLVIRRIAETRRILAASPEYLARHGTPRTLDARQQSLRTDVFEGRRYPHGQDQWRPGIE
jgi:DNA-binding transcriptional LysR family regulator